MMVMVLVWSAVMMANASDIILVAGKGTALENFGNCHERSASSARKANAGIVLEKGRGHNLNAGTGGIVVLVLFADQKRQSLTLAQ